MGDTINTYTILDGKPKGSVPLVKTGVDGRMILKRILGKCLENMDRTHLAQDRGQWWALEKTAMNLRVP
jgi:hypothetical protein